MPTISVNYEQLNELLRSFYTLTHIKIVVYNENYEKQVSCPSEDSLFCNYIANHPAFSGKCDECTRFFCEQSKAKKDVYIGFCHAGLTEAVVPLFDNQENVLGYIMFGQTSQLESAEKLYDHVLKTCEPFADISGAKDLLSTIRLRSMEEVESAAEILKTIANYIIIHQYITKKASYVVMDINRYIDAHIREHITVKDLCTHLFFSRTKLYHLVAEEEPGGLNNLILRRRIAAAEKLLTSTNLSVGEIAKEVGLPNSNYFGKIFRRFRKMSPTEFRKLGKSKP